MNEVVLGFSKINISTLFGFSRPDEHPFGRASTTVGMTLDHEGEELSRVLGLRRSYFVNSTTSSTPGTLGIPNFRHFKYLKRDVKIKF